MFGPTLDHEEIKRWASRHSALPAQAKRHSYNAMSSLLRFEFGNAETACMHESEPISWTAFFSQFERLGLVMFYDETPTAIFLQDSFAVRMPV